MTRAVYDIGIAGLKGIGSSLAMNIAGHGYPAAAYDATAITLRALGLEVERGAIATANSLSEFVGLLSLPRTVIVAAPSRPAAERLINELEPLLTSGDVIIDAGNAYFKDTDARAKILGARGIELLGVGVSGVGRCARDGVCIMAGGSSSAYDRVSHLLIRIAAKVNGEPCVAYLGPRSAGHYVGMIHSAVVQAVTQLIAETYDVMSRGFGMSDVAIQQVYSRWQGSEVASNLLGRIATRLSDNKGEIGARLFDLLVDEADRYESARWVSLEARNLEQSIPTIDVAVAMLALSSVEEGLTALRRMLGGRRPVHYVGKPELLYEQLKRALCVGMIATFAQGLSLLRAGSEAYRFELSIETIARIWRGSILRSPMLQDICDALYVQPHLRNLLLDPQFEHQTVSRRSDLLAVVRLAKGLGIPAPALAASLAYYESHRRVDPIVCARKQCSPVEHDAVTCIGSVSEQ
ncbi:MAG TPA: NAD(P)-binding domain-containing protein [Blastocatellia bacterium]|nr:NAD(P)-binding domain-containing protein [Blastocatellia bacterium]